MRATTNNKEMIEAQLKPSEDRLVSTSAAVLAFKQKHHEGRTRCTRSCAAVATT